jgi:tRNA-dihydrouridine synthase B
MAGYTDIPTRVLYQRFGAGMSVTEMVSATALVCGNPGTLQRLTLHPEERRVGVQVFGSEPQVLCDAVSIIAKEVSPTCVDLNMGCPVKKISKSGYGAALMKNPERVYKIVHSMAQASALPITVKIRSGATRDSVNFLEVAAAVQEGGAAAITIHPRTRSEGFQGRSNWEDIAQLKRAVKIPVIGNGDINDLASGIKMFHYTRCDGIMIGRAAVGNPWIFKQFEDYFEGRQIEDKPTPGEIVQVAGEHFDLESVLSRNPERAFLRVRKSLVMYFKGFKEFTSLCNMLRGANSNEELKFCLSEISQMVQQSEG